MNKLTKLNVECLANMPMLLDAMQDTATNLQAVLKPYYGKIERELQFFFDSNKRRRYAFNSRNNREGDIENLSSVYFIISFFRDIKARPTFAVQYGYESSSNEDDNVIYFQIQGDINVDEFSKSLEIKDDDNVIRKYVFDEEGIVGIHISVDNDFSEASIDKLYAEFREHILLPFFELLKQ